MTIQLACTCGRQFKVADEHAGKRAKCPACGAVQAIPTKAPAEAAVEVVDDAPPPAAKPAARAAPPESSPSDFRDGEKRKKSSKKKPKRRSSADKEGSLSAMYMEQAREQQRRDEARAKAAGGWGRDEGGGWTLAGIHLTAGVVGGAGMLILGLGAIAAFAIFRDEVIFGPRAIAGAALCALIGGITLFRSLFHGEED